MGRDEERSQSEPPRLRLRDRRSLDWDYALGPDVQIVDCETRELWIGPIGNRLYAAVLTERAEAYRVISLRVATNREIRLWREEFQNG